MRVILCMWLFLASDGLHAGRKAYEAGDFGEARSAFQTMAEAEGPDASPELLHNLALAALRDGDLLTAEIATEKAVARGGDAFVPGRDFLLGNIAFERCLRNAALADRPEAGPVALDLAIAEAESAIGFWKDATMLHDDWPAARRNAERAWITLEKLRARREEERKKRKKARDQKERTRTEDGDPPRDEPRRGEEASRPVAAQTTGLTPAQLGRLLDKLAEKEKRKRKIRSQRRSARTANVEKDW